MLLQVGRITHTSVDWYCKMSLRELQLWLGALEALLEETKEG